MQCKSSFLPHVRLRVTLVTNAPARRALSIRGRLATTPAHCPAAATSPLVITAQRWRRFLGNGT
eukprot:scaffold204278_cov46-Prasinocladus_malaysianus.AAC.1